MRVGARTLVARNVAQLVFTFLGSALLNVVSQAFFAAQTPLSREAWLSATLLVGTLASVVGGPAARRWGLGRRPLAAGLALVVGAVALFGGALTLTVPLAFAAASVGVRFLLQYGTQEFDRRAVELAGGVHRRANDLIGLGLRFGGMLVGPLWFGLVGGVSWATAAVLLALVSCGAWNAWAVAPAPAPMPLAPAHAVAASPLVDRALLAGARAIYAAYYLLASSIIYVLGETHHVPAATRAGGLLVTLVYGAAVVATVVELARRREHRRSPRQMLLAAGAMVVVGLALPAPITAQPLVLGAGGVLLGVAFARFQLAFRDHATDAALHRGRPALLSAYNNLANTSALVGYAAMAALVGVRHLGSLSSARAVGLGVAALAAVAVPLVIIGARAARAEDAGLAEQLSNP